MDLRMPGMDVFGYSGDTRRRLTIGPTIVVITAYGLDGDREKCIEAGMDNYIASRFRSEIWWRC
jgi:CheY-like chemotaxis protein